MPEPMSGCGCSAVLAATSAAGVPSRKAKVRCAVRLMASAYISSRASTSQPVSFCFAWHHEIPIQAYRKPQISKDNGLQRKQKQVDTIGQGDT